MSLQREAVSEGFPEEHRALASQSAGTRRFQGEWSMAPLNLISVPLEEVVPLQRT